MSTQPNLTPQWKEEVNRRLAAHRNRKNAATAHEASQHSPVAGTSRAAQAAARVAARYARAPSYSQMQVEGARVAVRAAEIATKVALEAQAAAESALAELHAASQASPSRGPAIVQPIAPSVRPLEAPAAAIVEPVIPPDEMSDEERGAAVLPVVPMVAAPAEPTFDRQSLGIRWDPDLPSRPVERLPAPARRVPEDFELSVDDWWSPAEVAEDLRTKPIEVDSGPAQANLIQFPRELVATRKMRPRLAEGYADQVTESEAQLSIFEVDPGTIATGADTPAVGADAAPSVCNRTDWSGMKLDRQPMAPASVTGAQEAEAFPVAPMSVRLMAGVVDCALILASFVAAGFLVAQNLPHPPTGKAAEVFGVAALALVGLLYYAFFFTFPVSTPGMKYARVGICTFDEQSPTRTQLRRRLAAMALSLLPVGLGFVWAVFDDDHLSWHDRYSQTYLRKC